MAKTSAAVVRITDPGMEWRDIDLNRLLACAKRELAFRQKVYPKMVLKGSITEEKADAETAQMQLIVDFLVHCIFKAVTRRGGDSNG